MDQITKQHFDSLQSTDANLRYASFQYIINLTKQPVDWAYEAWDDMLALTKNGDNHQRTIAVQVLSNLAKSDPEQRMLKDLEKLIAVTKDEKFVTARHSLQSLWKVGIASKELQKKVLDRLVKRFKECIAEKNCTLIRYDILEVLRKIYDQVNDEKIKNTSLALIETEDDLKYRKKYMGLWKDILKTGRERK
jgi:ribosomal protein L17